MKTPARRVEDTLSQSPATQTLPPKQGSLNATIAHTIEPAPPTASRPEFANAGRYTLGAEIARGGMGVVYRAVDQAISREVAVKVLHLRYAVKSAAAKRFVDEARIAGQLQHPGVPPVHDLGTLPDGRPYLVMKLIKGQTLEEAIDTRKSLDEDRGRYLAAFESLCQAVGYAHAHKVIHRDLKPANVMVGAFGEVQVMDWGLAKVLDLNAATPVDESDLVAETEIRTLRESDGSETQAGSVFGTPAFMPPEQAIGAVDQVSRRSDVFGLGGILAYILTGKPPYVGTEKEAVRIQAARGAVEECFARLDACGADPDFVALCKRCLNPDPAKRPMDAGIVAKVVGKLRAAADDRARLAELDRVRLEGESAKAEAEARDARKRRRLQAILAASLGLLLFGGAMAGWWINRQKAVAASKEAQLEKERADRDFETARAAAEKMARDEVIEQSTREALKDADAKLRDGQPAAALVNFKKAEGLLAGSGSDATRSAISSLARDFTILEKLDEAFILRFNSREENDPESVQKNAAKLYQAAFENYGIDAERGSTADMAAAINAKPIRRELVAGLISWANTLPSYRDRLLELIRLTDPMTEGPYMEFKNALGQRNQKAILLALQNLDMKTLPPNRVVVASGQLHDQGYGHLVPRFLQKAHDTYPNDFFITLGLAREHLYNPAAADWRQALSLGRLCAALRPESASAWVVMTEAAGRLSQRELQESSARQALAIRPNYSHAHALLAWALRERKKFTEAEQHIRRAIELDPGNGGYYADLGYSLKAQNRIGEAETALRTALTMVPGYNWPKVELARIERSRKNFTEAETLYRMVIGSGNAFERQEAAKDLMHIFLDQNQFDDALNVYCDASRKIKDFEVAGKGQKTSTAEQLAEKLKAGKALGTWLPAVRKLALEKPNDPDIKLVLGWLHYAAGDIEQAISEFRSFITLNPNSSVHWEVSWALGRLYNDAGRLDEAIASWRQVVRGNPNDYEALCNLGNALRYKCRYQESIAAYQQAAKADVENAGGWRKLIAFAYWGNGQLAEAVEHWKASGTKEFAAKQAFELAERAELLKNTLAGTHTTSDATELIELGRLCYFEKRYRKAVEFAEAGLPKAPQLATKFMANHYLSAAHAGLGHGVDVGTPAEQTQCRKLALKWLQEAFALNKKRSETADGKVRISIRRDIRMWTDHPDLAGLREPELLAKLPVEERNAWQEFWTGVHAFLNESQTKN